VSVKRRLSVSRREEDYPISRVEVESHGLRERLTVWSHGRLAGTIEVNYCEGAVVAKRLFPDADIVES
jgi:hypothetical protein